MSDKMKFAKLFVLPFLLFNKKDSRFIPKTFNGKNRTATECQLMLKS